AFDAAGVAAGAPRPAVPGQDLVVGLRPRQLGAAEAVADLDALERLHAHQRRRQPRVELAVPVHVAAQPGRHAVGDDLDDTAEGVALGPGAVDALLHARRG